MTHRLAHTGAVVAVLAAATSGFALAAPAAAAAGSFTSPQQGAVYRSDTTVAVRVQLGPLTRSAQLHLRAPDGTEHVVASGGSLGGGGTLGFDFDTACPSYPGEPACTGRRPALDGRWTAYLSGDASGQREFDLRIPPAPPVAPDATSTGPTTVRLAWPRGPEPDLTAYDVDTADGAAVVTGLAVGRVCSAGECAADIDFGRDAAGRHDLVLVAHRSYPGGGDLASKPSPATAVTLSGDQSGSAGAAPPAPVTSAGGSARPATAAGGSAGGSQRRFAAALRAGGLGAPALPPLPSVPDVTRIPAPQGSYGSRLHYALPPLAPATRASDVVRRRPSSALIVMRADAAGLVADRRLWQSIAAALVLTVLALHLRRLARRST